MRTPPVPISHFSLEKISDMSNRDPFDQAALEAAIAEKAEKDEQKLRQIRKSIAYVMATPEGRRAMEIILDITGLNQPSFSTNALTMGFNEGRRSVGLSLLSLCDPVSYQLLLKESHDRRIKHNDAG